MVPDPHRKPPVLRLKVGRGRAIDHEARAAAHNAWLLASFAVMVAVASLAVTTYVVFSTRQ
jgi:hypothetical protein